MSGIETKDEIKKRSLRCLESFHQHSTQGTPITSPSIFSCFLDICKLAFAPDKREVSEVQNLRDIELSDLSQQIERDVLPILRQMPAFPAGPWDTGQLCGWFRSCLLVIQMTMLQFGQVLLQHFLDTTLNGLDRRWSENCPEGPNRPCPCPQCGNMAWSYAGHELREKTFKSLLGFAVLRRHRAKCDACGHSFQPLDTILGLGSHKMFPLLQEACVLLGSRLSHAVSSQLLAAITSIHVSSSAIRARVKELGEATIARQETEGPWLEVERLKSMAKQCIEPVDLHGSLDGSHVPQDEKPKAEPGSHKEAYMFVVSVRNTVGKLYGKIAIARQCHLPLLLLLASQLIDECESSIENIRHFFLHGDGATWIESFAGCNPCLTFLLDWYHLKSNLWSLAKVLGKQATEYRRGVIKQVEDLLWNGKTEEAIARLSEMRFEQKGHRKERDRIITYIKDRIPFIRNYKWYYERAITIGSGEVEGAQKHLIADRLRCAGMRWSLDGADALIAARCTIYNETWRHDLLMANLHTYNNESTPQTQ